jgi:hypothetical protein
VGKMRFSLKTLKRMYGLDQIYGSKYHSRHTATSLDVRSKVCKGTLF